MGLEHRGTVTVNTQWREKEKSARQKSPLKSQKKLNGLVL